MTIKPQHNIHIYKEKSSELSPDPKVSLILEIVWLEKILSLKRYNQVKVSNKQGLKMNIEVYKQLKALKPILKERFGIEEFALFGSMAKGTDTKDSDIDIAILKSSQKNFLLRMEAIEYLKEIFNRKIDMGYFDSMKTFIRNRIQKEFVYV